MVRLAIVGNGERAARHQAALAMVDDVEVVTVVGPRADAPYQELFARADIDVVDLCAPPGPAADIAIAAATAGKRVIAEYPPGSSAEDAERVDRALREHGGALDLLLPERHQPLPQGLKATLESGKLGSLRYAHAAWIGHWSASDQAARREWDTEAPDGDVEAFVIEHAAGALDMVAWFFGNVPVTAVFARSCSLAGDGTPSRYVSTVLSFADASQAIVEMGLTNSLPANGGLQRLALTGTRGSAYFTERDHDILVNENGARALAGAATDGLAAAFSALLTNGAPDGARTAHLGFAAAESLRTGQPVEVGR